MKLWILTLAVLVTSCAHSTIVPVSTGGPLKTYPATDPVAVGIYRVTKPFPAFDQIGLISYQMGVYDMNSLYERIRTDAAEAGAQAVVDVKINGEHHVEMQPQQHCDPVTHCNMDGTNCWTEQVCRTDMVPVEVSTYTISGALIREKTK
jgi:hypothetical protein